MQRTSDVLDNVRRALGRTKPLETPPVPPVIDEPVTRLVHSDFGLPELFAKTAAGNKIYVEMVYVDELGAKLAEFLRGKGASRVALSDGGLLEKLGVRAALQAAGLEATPWSEMTLDALYDYDAGVTDAYAAVAETGSLVMRGSGEHARSLSLIPNVHVCILEPKNFVPDLVDLFDKLTREGTGSGVVIISGPSKTADIEMNLVTGVHGPGTVKAFILQ
jgi:L-lactate dehydrogenase complex protein LldG